ncbi:hypothetical protein KEM54_006584 [Ascosphaera aggregata]|nr:hypothetical protein KEM54_006584 [Ascosphaera aggregata]
MTESNGSNTDEDNADRRGVGRGLVSLEEVVDGEQLVCPREPPCSAVVGSGRAVTIEIAISVNVVIADVVDGLGVSSEPSVSGVQMTRRIGNNFAQLLTISAMLMKLTLAGVGGGTGRIRLLQKSSEVGIAAGLEGSA